ncbi:unnamed protein product [Adineta steineri]|uniref:Uncharacterized protein n=1 Tax=Adineta steineri TaxID=433720 RepID=A0A818LQ17_9BILA|nr:unnamed protein product [Adineta steineri]CAF1082201.1 unnamed protein product [Adineta steineri]CAF1099824.1 unnamed protein product [Adineta steineri]CAF1131633.1 unnamed protein product [Adineta steineri]CAF1263812.1 unnamed protein product [Adineta steineri]
MKLYVFVSVVLIILVQTYLSQAELTESSSENENLKHSFNKRLSSQWGKRLSQQWGKRSDSDSDELYQRILRELYQTARLKQSEHPRYSATNDPNPLTLEEFLAQRPTWNTDNDK